MVSKKSWTLNVHLWPATPVWNRDVASFTKRKHDSDHNIMWNNLAKHDVCVFFVETTQRTHKAVRPPREFEWTYTEQTSGVKQCVWSSYSSAPWFKSIRLIDKLTTCPPVDRMSCCSAKWDENEVSGRHNNSRGIWNRFHLWNPIKAPSGCVCMLVCVSLWSVCTAKATISVETNEPCSTEEKYCYSTPLAWSLLVFLFIR